MTNADYCKAYRARLAKRGLCIRGCGSKSTRPSGLCDACAAKTNEINKASYRKRKS